MLRSRYKSLLVGCALAAFVSPQLGALLDNLTNAHSYCAAHDDFVHGEDEERDTAQTHTHCEVWKTGLRPVEALERAPSFAHAKTPHAVARKNAPFVLASLPVYAFAPKTSPPPSL